MTDLRPPFFEAALAILGETGCAGLKQATLCRRVGVTTGAFYHSFDSWRDFTGQCLDFWRQERTTKLVALAEERTDPVERLEVLAHATTQLPHRAEAAIRVWAALDDEVARVQATVDAARLAVVRGAFTELVGPDQATAWADLGMAVLVGFEQRPGTTPEQLRWSLQVLLDTARGAAPPTSSSIQL